MDDEDLLRYSRHLLLNEIGIEGQERIRQARVLMIGAGGLGCAAGLFLGSAGVGELTVIDHDRVDLTNLQRQIAHTQERIGQTKVASLQSALHAINPGVRVNALALRADAGLLQDWVPRADLVLDCCDNFATRHAINAACFRLGVPLISAAAVRFDGQLSVYRPLDADSPCYACVFPDDGELEETRCATLGVFAPLVGIMGSMQAAEALKLLTGAGETPVGRLLMLDGRDMSLTAIRLRRNAVCRVCASR